MKTHFLSSESKRSLAVVLFLCLTAVAFPVHCQQKTKTTAKPVYDITSKGKFMKTWYIAGPISTVSQKGDSAVDLQKKAFESDPGLPVKMIGKVPASLKIKDKEYKWDLIQ